MAEIRKFDGTDSEGIQKLVREALGETIRPVDPGDPGARTGAYPGSAESPPILGDLGNGFTGDYLVYDGE